MGNLGGNLGCNHFWHTKIDIRSLFLYISHIPLGGFYFLHPPKFYYLTLKGLNLGMLDK